MVRISDIVSALLKGLTIARIKSDIFSGNASSEYLNDPNLQSYPVPRFEIRSADMDLKFSVIETVQRNLDTLAIMVEALSEGLPGYLDKILAIPVKPTSTDPPEAYQPLSAYLGSDVELIKNEIVAEFLAYFELNAQVTYDQLMDFPRKFGSRTVRDKTYEVVPTVLANHAISVWLDDSSYTSAVAAEAELWGIVMHDAVILAVEVVQAQFFELDLAVKKDQLLDVPEHVISSASFVFVVENYEWTITQDQEGNTVKKLTRK